MEEVVVARVESYVEEKKEWIKSEQKVRSGFLVAVSLNADGFIFAQASQKHCKNLARLEEEEQDEARARRDAVRDSQVAYVAFVSFRSRKVSLTHWSITIRTAKTLKDDYDWEDDEIDYLLSWRGFGKLAPKATIEEKPKGMLLDSASSSQMSEFSNTEPLVCISVVEMPTSHQDSTRRRGYSSSSKRTSSSTSTLLRKLRGSREESARHLSSLRGIPQV